MQKMNNTQTREPLFHVIKRGSASKSKGYAAFVRFLAIVIGFLLSAIICALLFKTTPFSVIGEMFNGVFGTERRVWNAAKETALLLGVGLALVPAFKMKFYNLGGNGQILMGALAATACMFYLGGKMPDGVINIVMVITSILAGAIWAVIPAIFKAFFKTNESLFTLMMNYIAAVIVELCITVWVPSGSGTLSPMIGAGNGNLPKIANNKYLLTLIVMAVIDVFMWLYLKKSKHGYELSVVGGSENTARYIGLNVKKVVIRTVALSGALCGVVGLMITGAFDYSISSSTANNMGFTSIMVAWLAQFDPVAMIGTAFMIAFVTKGMGQVQTAFKITDNSVAQVVTAIIYFCIIACRFFISYKIVVRNGSFVETRKVFAKISEFFNKIFSPVGKFLKKCRIAVKNFFNKIFAAIGKFFKNLFTSNLKNKNKGDNE